MSLHKVQFRSLSLDANKNIHELLTPLIHRIKHNKINSYFQLKNEKSGKQATIFYCNPFAKEKRGQQALQNRRMIQGIQSQTAKYSSCSPQVKNLSTSNPPLKVNKFMKNNSKIKKHLISSIDFEEIEKMLFKKNRNMTRYELFLKDKCRRKLSNVSQDKNVSNQMKVTKQNFFSPSKDPIDESMINKTVQLRTTAKKKFWTRNFTVKSERRNMEGNNLLQGLQGKSYCSIQT